MQPQDLELPHRVIMALTFRRLPPACAACRRPRRSLFLHGGGWRYNGATLIAWSPSMITDRRHFFTALATFLAAPAAALAQAPAMSRITAYAFSFAGLAGGDIPLSDFPGKLILVVTTASQCGYTPQFTGLQQLYARFHDKGLIVIGVPSNDFGGQEPGTPVEIMKTAHEEYGVRFPLAAKV